MITKEEFLENTREEEIFSLVHEFIMRYNELMKEEHTQEILILDKDINIIAEQMITELKSQEWL